MQALSNDIQYSIVGSVITDNSLYYRYLQEYDSCDYLTNEYARTVLTTVCQRIGMGERVNMIKAKALNPEYEKHISDMVLKSDFTNFELYFNEAVCAWKSNEIEQVVYMMHEQLKLHDDPDEIIHNSINALSNVDKRKRESAENYAESVNRVALNIIKRRESGAKLSGIDTSYKDLNFITDGYQQGDLIVTGGRPGMGKTTESLIEGYRMAKLGATVLFFSLEMGIDAVNRRLYAYELEVPVNRLRRGDITQSQAEQLTLIADKIVKTPLRIIENCLSIEDIESEAYRFSRIKKVDHIIIDYIQIVRNTSQRDKRLQVSNTCERLKQLAKNLKCSINGLAQLSRTNAGNIPTLKDLKESAGLEENADMVKLLHRPGYYDEHADQTEAQIIIAKMRDGETKTLYRSFGYPFVEYKEGEQLTQNPIVENDPFSDLKRFSPTEFNNEFQF